MSASAPPSDEDVVDGRRLGVRGFLLVLLLAATVGATIGVIAHFVFAPDSPKRFAAALPALHGQASWKAGERPAPDFTLRNQDGHLVSLSSLRGRPVAMTFLDSYCREVCPLQGRALSAALRTLPRAQRPVVVVVSVNPLDTAVSAHKAARSWGLDRYGAWHWFMGSASQLRRVWHDFHIFVRPVKGDIEHTEALYLIDRHGDERSGYLYPFLPNFVTLDLGKLAREPT